MTLCRGKPRAFKDAVLLAVHGALVASGVSEKDRFHRVLELGPDDIMVVFKETLWGNWSFAGGRLIHT